MIITDRKVSQLYLEDIKRSLPETNISEAIIANGERAKDFQVFYDLHTKAIKAGLDRRSAIIALGGGAVGDVAGFVASTYMRGIDYIQMPTTILAHDSSVGGKVAINHEYGKNLIGAFYPPVAVIYDVNTLESLPVAEVRSGYAEIMKEAMLANKPLYYELLHTNVKTISKRQLYDHLYAGITIKKDIVTIDEKESHERKFLNLGHTFAHALETNFSTHSLLHGEAVALGLLFALFVSEQYFETNLNIQQFFSWLKLNNYPLPFEDMNPKLLARHIQSDKKVINGIVQFVLLKEIGKPTIRPLSITEIEAYIDLFLKKIEKGVEFD